MNDNWIEKIAHRDAHISAEMWFDAAEKILMKRQRSFTTSDVIMLADIMRKDYAISVSMFNREQFTDAVDRWVDQITANL